MVQLRNRLGFALEAGFALRAFGEVLREDLDRYGPVQAGVFGFIDLTHAPSPNGCKDLVGTQACSRVQGHRMSIGHLTRLVRAV